MRTFLSIIMIDLCGALVTRNSILLMKLLVNTVPEQRPPISRFLKIGIGFRVCIQISSLKAKI